MTRQFLSTRSIAAADRFTCFEIEGVDAFANIARQVEREVFEAAFGNDPVMLTDEYAPYEESSVFFLAVDTQAETPAGVVRMIRNSPAGHKTLVDMEDGARTPTPVRIADVMRYHGIDDLDHCWDGASAVVRRPYRRRFATILAQLLKAWFAAAVREDVTHIVSILDAPVYRIVRQFLGVPLVPLADTPPFTYMGAPNHQAVYAPFSTALASATPLNRKLGQKVQACVSGDRAGRERQLVTPHRAR